MKDYLVGGLSKLYSDRESSNIITILFESISGWDRMELRSNLSSDLSESELLKYHFALKRLLDSEPIQYVASITWFYGLEFHVEAGVLIPRPETEELVDLIVKECSDKKSFLDIGTGSGCIPLSIKSVLKTADVLGVDVSEVALKIARINAKKLKLDVDFYPLDILKQSQLPSKFDVIVSNPPYITESEKQLMSVNVLQHEPHLALFVPNEDPLKFYRAIADFSLKHLNVGGCLYFEINENLGIEVVELLKLRNFTDIRLINDLQGKNRIVAANI